jgi:hypothetical protein
MAARLPSRGFTDFREGLLMTNFSAVNRNVLRRAHPLFKGLRTYIIDAASLDFWGDPYARSCSEEDG